MRQRNAPKNQKYKTDRLKSKRCNAYILQKSSVPYQND